MNASILEHFGVQHPQPSDDQLLSEAKSRNQQHLLNCAFGTARC